jgi:two-component system sensor histidine kinase/response regulator
LGNSHRMHTPANELTGRRIFRSKPGNRTSPFPALLAPSDGGGKEGGEKNWLAVAAHELRSPLGSICGIAEFLHEGAGGELTLTQQQLVATIRETSWSLLKMVEEILDLAAEDGESPIQLSPCDLAQLVGRRVAMMNLQAAPKKTQIRFEAATETACLAIDPGKIAQVIDNLLSNAVKYSPPGATVTASLRRGTEPDTIHVCVRDQGPGIPPAEEHRLFACFGRLSTRPTAGEKSIGLGLAICRKIADAHRGRIEFENLAGGGCEFRLVLPADEHAPGATWAKNRPLGSAPAFAA